MLLITGVLTYVGVLEEMGTIDSVGEEVADVGAPLLAALQLCYVGAIVSAFASSVGVLGAFMANAKGVDQDVFYRQLLVYGAVIVAVVPPLAWLVLIAIGG